MILKTKSLPPEIVRIVRDKGTEHPFTGELTDFGQPGTYLCRQCGLALYRSYSKFHSNCGWPSFDEEIANTIHYQTDSDGHRTEILCARCQAHLGHVFHGEGFTEKNTRHCVNSASLDHIANLETTDTEEAIYAAGCFWGVEHYFKQLAGVLKTEVGYSGGHQNKPSYQDVCTGTTGHFEVIRVIYDPKIISYENLTKYFFEIHNPIQADGQGPDIGHQYLSVIFYYDENQKHIAEKLIALLENMHYKIKTQILPVATFWRAEEYHQDYYAKTNKEPYCHRYEKRF